MKNNDSLDTICASLAKAIGISAPEFAADSNKILDDFISKSFDGERAERVFMYNPDAIAQWVYEKYASYFDEANARAKLKLPLCSVMPSVTPVCFGTMYTGAQPDIHGIKAYVKPVIKIDTIFDALIRAGKRVALVSTTGDSLSIIYLEREMDYFIYDTVEEINEKARKLIEEDNYDFIVVYNANFDSVMHKFGPESPEALAELKANTTAFCEFNKLIEKHWKAHNTLVAFAMDHGCHEIDGDCGSHGLDMEEDLNIVHTYKAFPKSI